MQWVPGASLVSVTDPAGCLGRAACSIVVEVHAAGFLCFQRWLWCMVRGVSGVHKDGDGRTGEAGGGRESGSGESSAPRSVLGVVAGFMLVVQGERDRIGAGPVAG